MRRTVASLCSLLVLSALPSTAREISPTPEHVSPKQNAVYVGPLSLLLGSIAWEYERAISDQQSIAVGVPLTLPFGLVGALSNATGASIFGVGGMLAFRHYFTGTSLNGLFAGPELNVGYASLKIGSVSASGLSYGVTSLVGYSFLTDSGFALSGGLGVGVGSAGVSASAGGQSTGVVPAPVAIYPALRLHVGWGF